MIDLTVTPLGTASTSMSEEVAAIWNMLEKYEGKIRYEQTAMSTLMEGDLDDIFAIVKEIHELPFQQGAKRVATNIRIDDRRDGKEQSIQEKLASAKKKMA